MQLGNFASMRTVFERFWLKVEKTESCWIWVGASDGKGYGKMNISGKTISAHRLSWEMAWGESAGPRMVLHGCDNPPCVRPSHLHLGTSADNLRECVERGRHNEAVKTHCKNGHPFDEGNTYRRPGRPNSRGCRACNNAASLAYYPKRGHRKKEDTQ